MAARSKRRAQRSQRVAKWTSGISWICCLLTIFLIIIMNSAGISVNDRNINGESYAILTFTAPYEELDTPVSLAYTYHLFPNGVCAKPTGVIDSTVGPYCIYNKPFKRYNLSYVLEKGDERVQSNMKFSFGNGTFPTETLENARLDPFDTAAPTVLYILAAICAFFALITLPKGFCGIKWSFGRKLLNLCIASVAFATATAASGLWTYKAYDAAKDLSAGTNVDYIQDVYVGKSFLIMTWVASISMFITMLLLVIEQWFDRKQANNSERDRGSFVRLSESLDRFDRASKSSVTSNVVEQRPQTNLPVGRGEMPGYEPLRA